MASQIRRLLINTRERITSTDLNDAHALQHRALIEALGWVAGESGMGVLGGLEISSAGGLSVSVAAGLALQSGVAPTTYDSAIQWLELATAQVVDLSSYVDATNPRWVCVEIAAADAVELSTSRDVWQPASGTFVSASVDKVRGSDPVITVTAGAAAAVPIFPAGVAGRVPLGYAYLPAAAASITNSEIVGCRPVARPLSSLTGTSSLVHARGGGVSVPADGLSIRFSQCYGQFGAYNVPFSIGTTSATTMTLAAGGMDGAAFPGSDDVLYFYATSPPYPAGYDTSLVFREFVPGTPGAFTAAMFPNLVPTAGRIRNCIVVASTSEPTVDSVSGFAQGGGSFSVTSAPWGSGSVSAGLRTNSVYLGAAFFDFSASGLVNQSVRGDAVTPRVVDSASHANPRTRLHNATTWIANGSDINVWNSSLSDAGGTADNVHLPITAAEVEVSIVAATATATSFIVFLGDQSHPYGPGVSQSHEITWSGTTTAGSATFDLVVYPNATGEVDFISGVVTAATTDLGELWVHTRSYRDVILAQR